jgi:hypothetical protein
VIDQNELCVRKITATGTISTVAGNGTLAQSGFAYLTGIAVDSTCNLYLSEHASATRIDPYGLAVDAAGDDQTAGSSTLYDYPYGIALNSGGEIIVADPIAAAFASSSPTTHPHGRGQRQ